MNVDTHSQKSALDGMTIPEILHRKHTKGWQTCAIHVPQVGITGLLHH
jgi:hypothetical protein